MKKKTMILRIKFYHIFQIKLNKYMIFFVSFDTMVSGKKASIIRSRNSIYIKLMREIECFSFNDPFALVVSFLI
ncbi:hypothetical protein BpHYR1_037460 [Brachionus plicatilis]|uniref:Uncharacterized protein n=1 Tax=Brachionus plicatilis TaxID=10195 RepID=A0A3M7S6Q7_BRAPC|nr:hypothetical protein BpHYR1_037460 [Brachionus plicatilis]